VYLTRFPTIAVTAGVFVWMLCAPRPANAIDFYEIQIYPAETTPVRDLDLELHTNSVISATGEAAHEELGPYQIHATLEGTYGVLPWLEVGQYLATARLDDGNYQYAGSRTKVHFSIPQTASWPIWFGGNLELEYMRRAAEENPLALEMRPIAQTELGQVTLIGNFAFTKPFSGSGTHDGVSFAPSGLLQYERAFWGVSPAVEYYGDLGPVRDIPGAERQQHFLVPALNVELLGHLSVNVGVGFGLTDASDGTFVKTILGWMF
jgi:hypothetical protein